MPDKNSDKKKRRYFLIDYENVKTAGFEGIELLEKTDSVIIFYSQNADKLTFDMHEKILRTKAKIDYFMLETIGQNALDFQLSSYIGYIIGKKHKCECCIVSNDRGFENVRNFWRKRGVRVKLIPNIMRCINAVDVKKSAIKNALTEASFEEEDAKFVSELVWDALKDEDITVIQMKRNINRDLCKKFGNEKTKGIYAVIKQFLK